MDKILGFFGSHTEAQIIKMIFFSVTSEGRGECCAKDTLGGSAGLFAPADPYQISEEERRPLFSQLSP